MGRATRRHVSTVALLVYAVILTTASASPAPADTTRGIGVFGPVQGSAGRFTTTVRLPGTGYPRATASSTASSASLPLGTSTWFGSTTPPGELFGPSREQPYLTLSPAANNPSAPSVTTYTFDGVVPVGWGFVVGDIDSDKLRVSAVTADGSPASTAELGFRGTFNPCDSTPRASGCSTSEAKDQPTWDPGTATLTGNPTGANTYGASGWFVPTTPLRSLTLTFTWRTGLPIYQTWFGAVSRDVTGTVTASGGCDLSATNLRLLGSDGEVLATTRPGADGSYRFDRVAATDAFRVGIVDLPEDCEAAGPAVRPVDLTSADARADFVVARSAATSVVSGEVTEQGTGDPVAGATLTIERPADLSAQATTDAAGRYALPPVEPGRYEVRIDPPDGLVAVGGATRTVVVPATGGPLALDFVLRPVTSASATPASLPNTGR